VKAVHLLVFCHYCYFSRDENENESGNDDYDDCGHDHEKTKKDGLCQHERWPKRIQLVKWLKIVGIDWYFLVLSSKHPKNKKKKENI
jgi:hypothetical protein